LRSAFRDRDPFIVRRKGSGALGLRIALAAYVVIVAVIAFFPTPVDRPIDHSLDQVLAWLGRHGAPFITYRVVEFSANVALFVPLGLLIAMILGRRRWWWAIVVCACASSLVELSQGVLLVHRLASVADIVSNSIGGAIGAVVGRGLIARPERTRGGAGPG